LCRSTSAGVRFGAGCPNASAVASKTVVAPPESGVWAKRSELASLSCTREAAGVADVGADVESTQAARAMM
jgi:hypothetical protein